MLGTTEFYVNTQNLANWGTAVDLEGILSGLEPTLNRIGGTREPDSISVALDQCSAEAC